MANMDIFQRTSKNIPMERQIPSVPQASRYLNHSPKRGKGTTRSSLYALVVLLCLLSSIQFAFASDSRPETTIMETPFFLEEDTLQLCKNDLATADANMDGELSSSEFVTFLDIYSQGAIVVPKFAEVPLRILMIYFWAACLCSTEPSEDPQCCVGDRAHVNLNFEDQAEGDVYLFVFCSQVREGIVDVLSGSHSPSQSPSLAPTRIGAPSANIEPTSSPTGLSQQPAAPPTTAKPSPTSLPINTELPTNTPSWVPSASPTISISALPSIAPSLSHSLLPTPAVSAIPSFSPPSHEPSSVPISPPPTLCVNFQYVLTNDANLTADDIFNEVDNTLKPGLLVATETTVVSILNASFPMAVTKIANVMSLIPAQAKKYQTAIINFQQAISRVKDFTKYYNTADSVTDPENWVRRLPGLKDNVEFAVVDALGGNEDTYDRVHVEMEASTRYRRAPSGRLDNLHRSLPERQASTTRGHQDRRRLVIYTQEIPAEISKMADVPDALCSGGGSARRCAIVTSSVCVVLSPNDDEVLVRQTVVTGLADAIYTGEFLAAIPPENRPPATRRLPSA